MKFVMFGGGDVVTVVSRLHNDENDEDGDIGE